MPEFLPTTEQEMRARGWDAVDFVFVSGDAYVDHPSFAMALLSRLLEREGYRIGIAAQPKWRDDGLDIARFGRPRLGFLVSAGNMDSMVNHYTVAKRRRKEDAYSPGGKMGLRPDYATAEYARLIKRRFPQSPVIAGGIEASLRRLAHYDYWSDGVKKSLLVDAPIDLVIYGMGERALLEVVARLDAGEKISDITDVRGTAFLSDALPGDALWLPYYQDIVGDKKKFAKSFYRQYQNTDAITARRLVEPYNNEGYVVQNAPAAPLERDELDALYELPFARAEHPSYESLGGIPAIEEVRFSLASCRGCFGGCSFCALTFHQGRGVRSRSRESLVKEAEGMARDPLFKGYIHDVGGPTANFRAPSCQKQLAAGVCADRQCLFPEPCAALEADHSDYRLLLRELRAVSGVKKVFVRSGLRFDYILADPNSAGFLRELVEHHISGQLKLAPEHVSDEVLKYMGKPQNSVYKKFTARYEQLNRELGKKQFIVPYLMSSHPGSSLKEAVELAEYLRDARYTPEQVQDFYPTPGTISTAMYYTGLDPRTMQPVYVPKDPHEKAMQRALLQYKNPKNAALVREALVEAGRRDLVGTGPKCLVKPAGGAQPIRTYKKTKQKNFRNQK